MITKALRKLSKLSVAARLALSFAAIIGLFGVSFVNVLFSFEDPSHLRAAAVVEGAGIALSVVFAVIMVRSVRKHLRELREATELNEMFITKSPLIMNIWDGEGRLVSTSPQSAVMLGLEVKEQYITRFDDLSPEYQPCGASSRELVAKYLARAFDEGYAHFEWTHQKLNGEPVPAEIILERFTRGGKPFIAAFTIDLRPALAIRQRDAAEAEWEKFKILFDTAPFVCAVQDADYGFLELSDNITDFLGIPDKQAYIDDPYAFYPEFQPDGSNSRERSLELARRAIEEGSITYEWWYKAADGTLIPCEETYSRASFGGKDVVIAWVRDLRESYENKEMSERIQMMFDATPLMIEYWDKDCNSLDCNRTTLEFFGFSSKDEYSKYLYEEKFYTPQDEDGRNHREKWNAHLKKIFENGHGRFEWAEPRPDGSIVPLEVEGTCIKYKDDIVVVTYSKDVTNLRELQKEQNRAQIAEESNRAKTMFIANISHEIRTPMNSILGFTELALDGSVSKETRNYLDKIATNTKWLLAVINDVLDISKIESGILELEQIPFDIAQITEYCLSLLLVSARNKGLMLNLDLESSRPDGKLFLGDPVKLSQVCINLLSNAVKFTYSGSVSFSVTLTDYDDESVTLCFEVADTGTGMTEEQVARIFEPFMQADSSTTRKHGGTGLGLPISRRLIEAMGGKLEVESEVGRGSVFSFILTFPTVSAESVHTGGSAEAEIEKPWFDKGDILVVDDNRMNLGVVTEHLRRVGLSSFVAMNGREAVEAVRERIDQGEEMYDLILMDVHMPEMDGKEAAKIISGLNLGVPIVAMTAETMLQAEAAPYRSCGMEGYLGKPFTAQQLWKCLTKFL